MRTRLSWSGLLALLALLPLGLSAQQAADAALPGPPVRPIASASAVSTERLGAVMGVRELPDGRLLVNDGLRRRLLLMDSTLKTVGVLLDSATDNANTYGTRPGTLIPFRGDSTLFVDPAAYAMLVIDPAGRIVRVRSVWRVRDIMYFTGMYSGMDGRAGTAGLDARGRVVYRIPAQSPPPRGPIPGGVPYIPPQPDSAFVVAADVDTRSVDTVGVVRIQKMDVRLRRTREGGFRGEALVNPLPIVDDWAVLSDGTVAFVRGRDYHVDYRGPDGKITSSPRLPYPWQRLADADKERLLDSLRTAQRRQAMSGYVSQLIAWVNQGHRAYPRGFKLPDGFRLPPGLPRDAVLPPGVTFPPGYLYACAPGQVPQGGNVVVFGAAPSSPAVAGAPAQNAVRVQAGVTMAVPAPGAAQAPTPAPAGAQQPPGAAPGAAAATRVVAAPAGASAGAAAATGAIAPPPAGAPASPPASAAVVAAPPAALGAATAPSPPGTPQPPAGAAACAPMPPLMYPSRTPPVQPGEPGLIPASDLPDYRPPIAAGSVRADLDGNLWIRTQARQTGGPVFDVVSRAGQLEDRLQLPPGYTVVGFGEGRVVYLSMRDAAGVHLARVRLR